MIVIMVHKIKKYLNNNVPFSIQKRYNCMEKGTSAYDK